jgi:hypothetical protein
MQILIVMNGAIVGSPYSDALTAMTAATALLAANPGATITFWQQINLTSI